jgi:hypothetical protein
MSKTTIATQVHQALDIDRHLSTKITLNRETTNLLSKTLEIRIRQILYLAIKGHATINTQLLCSRPANAIDRHQTDFRVLVRWDINASDTSHDFPLEIYTYYQNQPWRCLCRGSVQITRTTPLRRITLQFLHIFLTDAATFIITSGAHWAKLN